MNVGWEHVEGDHSISRDEGWARHALSMSPAPPPMNVVSMAARIRPLR